MVTKNWTIFQDFTHISESEIVLSKEESEEVEAHIIRGNFVLCYLYVFLSTQGLFESEN